MSSSLQSIKMRHGLQQLERLRHKAHVQITQEKVLGAQVAEARAARVEYGEELEPLMPVLKRTAFLHRAARELTLSQDRGDATALLYIEVGTGPDECALAEIAQTLGSVIRKKDLIGRIGCDGFAVLLRQAGPEHAHDVVGRLRLAVAKQHQRMLAIGMTDLSRAGTLQKGLKELIPPASANAVHQPDAV